MLERDRGDQRAGRIAGDRVTATRIDSGLRPIPDPSEVRRDENHPPDHGREALAFCLVLTIASTAGAKFTSHNGEDLTQTDVVQGSEVNTCGHHVSGLIGWGTTLTLEQLGGTLPAVATGPADYEVFRFPPGSNPGDYIAVFDSPPSVVLRYELVVGGTVVDTAPKIVIFASAPGRDPAAPSNSRPSSTRPRSSTSTPRCRSRRRSRPPFPSAPSLRSSRPAKRPSGSSPSSRVRRPPTDVVASIDAQPGLSVNKVKVPSGLPTLVILVKGSATFDVTEIASASVGPPHR